MLLKMLEALHARTVVAYLVVFSLSLDPILDPLLAERLLLTLAAFGVPEEALPKMFKRAMGVIFEMILMASARSKAADQKKSSFDQRRRPEMLRTAIVGIVEKRPPPICSGAASSVAMSDREKT
jgi:hypothetical protein